MTVSDQTSPGSIRGDLRSFLVDRFGDDLEMFTTTYLSVVTDYVNWDRNRHEQAGELIAQLSTRGLIPDLWQALRDDLVPQQPQFSPEIDRLEAGWRDDSERLWEAIRDAAGEASNEAFVDLAYDPQTYLRRSQADGVVSEFLDSGFPAMILTGESGVGKTTFGIDWTLRLAEEGNGSLFLAGKWMSSDSVWDQIATALNLGGDNWLELIGETARENDERLVVIIDGINEISDSDGGVKAFESLNSRLPDVSDQVRIIVTVTKPAWHRLESRVRSTIREGRYYSPDNQLTLELAPFDDEELKDAWGKYQEKFGIATTFADIPPTLRHPLRNPAMMHLLAAGFEDGALPETEVITTSDFFRKYFETKVGSRDERKLLEGIASLMFEAATTPMDRVAIEDDDDLSDMVSDSIDSAYAQLLDKDVIREFEERGAFLPERVVEYTIQKFGAWVLAGYLASRAAEPDAQAALIEDASRKFATYPPAWDAASMLLVQVADDEIFLTLAGSERTEVRELVIDAAAELAVSQPGRVKQLVDQMLKVEGEGSDEAHRTGFGVAHRATIKNPAVNFDETFIAIARGADDDLRESLHDTLYLIWRHDPDYTVAVLQMLVAQLDRGQLIRFWELPATSRLLGLLAEVVVTLYTTNPNVEFGRRVGDLGHELVVDRLRIVGIAGNDLVQKLMFPIVDRRFSEHIYKGFLVNDPEAINKVFNLDDVAKENFRIGIELLNPKAELGGNTEVLGRLFGATDSDISSLLAAQALAVHLITDFDSAGPVAQTVFASGDSRAQSWLLTSFLVLLETTPPSWVPLLEELTLATVEQNAAILAGEDGILEKGHIDQILLPLGLAYGKRGTDMPVFDELIDRMLAGDDALSAARCVRSFGSIGFYHPRVVRDTIRQLWIGLSENDEPMPGVLFDALVDALVTIRVLHPNIVDDLLLDLADEPLQAEVRNASKPDWLDRQISLLGLFNNGVHQAVCNPIMLDNLLVPIYEMLIEAEDLRHAVQGLTKRGWDLVEACDYRLDLWMGPATGGVCC